MGQNTEKHLALGHIEKRHRSQTVTAKLGHLQVAAWLHTFESSELQLGSTCPCSMRPVAQNSGPNPDRSGRRRRMPSSRWGSGRTAWPCTCTSWWGGAGLSSSSTLWWTTPSLYRPWRTWLPACSTPASPPTSPTTSPPPCRTGCCMQVRRICPIGHAWCSCIGCCSRRRCYSSLSDYQIMILNSFPHFCPTISVCGNSISTLHACAHSYRGVCTSMCMCGRCCACIWGSGSGCHAGSVSFQQLSCQLQLSAVIVQSAMLPYAWKRSKEPGLESHCSIRSAQHHCVHAGAATVDILQQYVSAIRALRAVDPSRGLVKAVGAPIQGYLRGRTDAIRCIVAALTNTSEPGEGGEDAGGLTLADELARQPDEQVAALRICLPNFIRACWSHARILPSAVACLCSL